MKAMVLAAGRGTRLRPFTERQPKILVPVLGVPMLDRLRAFLAAHGVGPVAMNTHHLPEAVQAHLAAGGAGGALPAPRLFHEPELLGTGGALINAGPFWGDDPLLLWNGDILADVAPAALLAALLAAQAAHGKAPSAPPLATLVVQARPSDSHLLVDATGAVCGLDSARRGERRVVGAPRKPLRPLAFNGISLLSPALRGRLPAGGAFDLIDALLDAVQWGGPGSTLRAFDAGDAFYGTTGSPAQLSALEAGLAARPNLLAAWTPAL